MDDKSDFSTCHHSGREYLSIIIFSGGQPYSSRPDRRVGFPDGKIGGSYYSLGEAFPQTADSTLLQFVDLVYVKPASLTPSPIINFTAGVRTGNLTVNEPCDNLFLVADDRDSHKGTSGGITIYTINDFAVLSQASTSTPKVGSNLAYTFLAVNTGSIASTGVFITNTLPANADMVSSSLNQGTYVQTSGKVICDIRMIGNLSGVTLTITVSLTEAGSSITNTVTITRNEAGANLVNNQASLVHGPSFTIAQSYAEAFGNIGPVWSGFGSAISKPDEYLFHR